MRVGKSIAPIIAGLSMVAAFMVASGRASAGAQAGLINFDDVSAPCNFLDMVALRDEYASLGVHFRGNDALNGGGILNECGNFGVTGYSAPNFLAFSRVGQFSDGGHPIPPQSIYFDNPVGGVRIKAGSETGGTVKMTAFNTSHQVVGSQTLAMTPELQTLTIVGQDIKGVVIKVDGGDYWVIDDLQWR